MSGERIVIVAGAVLAFLLQVVLAPQIALFSAIPNFLVVYTVVVAMLYPGNGIYVMAFILGFVSDFLGYGPVGITPALLVIASVVASRVHVNFADGGVLVPVVILVIAIALIEIISAVVMVAMGYAQGGLFALVYRAIPACLYNCVLGILLYPLLSRLLSTGSRAIGSVVTGPQSR